MLVQSLQLNSTIGGLADLCEDLRTECGDLSEMKVSVSMLIVDVMKAIGVPDEAVAMILKPGEVITLGDHPVEHDHADNVVKCQFCGDEAQRLIRRRGNWVLVCDTCESKIKHS